MKDVSKTSDRSLQSLVNELSEVRKKRKALSSVLDLIKEADSQLSVAFDSTELVGVYDVPQQVESLVTDISKEIDSYKGIENTLINKITERADNDGN